MDLRNLKNGDVIFFSNTTDVVQVGMYLDSTIVTHFSPALVIMGKQTLTCMSQTSIENAALLTVFRYEDESLTASAAEKIQSWLMYRLPFDAQRENSKNDYTLPISKSLFATQGFYNIAKFAIRNASNGPLTRQKLNDKGKGLRMSHLILLAFQISYIESEVRPSESWFSLKDHHYDLDCFEHHMSLNLIERIPKVFQISGKYLPAQNLLDHFSVSTEFSDIATSSKRKSLSST